MRDCWLIPSDAGSGGLLAMYVLREDDGVERHIIETERDGKRARERQRIAMLDWMRRRANVRDEKEGKCARWERGQMCEMRTSWDGWEQSRDGWRKTFLGHKDATWHKTKKNYRIDNGLKKAWYAPWAWQKTAFYSPALPDHLVHIKVQYSKNYFIEGG